MKRKIAFGKLMKKSVATVVTATLVFPLTLSTAFAQTDYSRLARVTQPTYTHAFAEDELAVVNFAPKWDDKSANVTSMVNYINKAETEGTKILLFPEMCVTGYASSSNPNSEAYKMPIRNAETIDGPTEKMIAALSDKYDMWIVYGGTQVVYNADGTVDTQHAYNTAFACSPTGMVTAYQKITPVEGSWCKSGTTPVLLDAGEYGKIGLSICYDTYATPELGRYYAAQGCNLLLNPTATSRSYSKTNDKGWEWYYKDRLESCASREGYTIMSADLVGPDGPVKDNGDKTYLFPGGSVIIQGQYSGPIYYAGVADSQLGVANTNADILTGAEGMLTNCASVTCATGTTCNNKDFDPEMYAQLYKQLADEQAAGNSLKYTTTDTAGPKAAVVNMAAKWGDKQANIDAMTTYVEQAAAQGVNILVFPETVLTGYEYQKPASGENAMQVNLAETIPGPTSNYFADLAKQYGMYIIFGMTQLGDDGQPIYDNGVAKVYNSAAICEPDGSIDSYQKIHRAGSEDQWSVPGTTPEIIDTQWGKVGIDICRDGHFYPELGRYYAAQGCKIFIHPTATTGNPWYRETRIGSYTDRDGMAAITCNLLGGDGTYDAATGKWSGGVFNSTSLIITKYHDANGNTSWDPTTGYAIDLNGTGTASAGYATRGTSPVGLETATMNLKGCGFSISNFNPGLFSQMYDKLAQLYRTGYQTLYPGESVAEPTSVDLSIHAGKANIAKIKVLKENSGKKVVKITLKKTGNVTGYQIRCSKTSTFKTALKTIKTSSQTITITVKANENTKLYFDARAYVKADAGAARYGTWSSLKKIA